MNEDQSYAAIMVESDKLLAARMGSQGELTVHANRESPTLS